MHLVCQFLATTWCAHCNVNKTIHGKACQPPLGSGPLLQGTQLVPPTNCMAKG